MVNNASAFSLLSETHTHTPVAFSVSDHCHCNFYKCYIVFHSSQRHQKQNRKTTNYTNTENPFGRWSRSEKFFCTFTVFCEWKKEHSERAICKQLPMLHPNGHQNLHHKLNACAIFHLIRCPIFPLSLFHSRHRLDECVSVWAEVVIFYLDQMEH